MNRVLIAGATGYLGRHLCAEYQARGWHVTALVRRAVRDDGLLADRVLIGEATVPATLEGTMENVDLVISALGITRQKDGLGYWDVDYRANLNLLDEAVRSGVEHFAYVHVLNADQMADVPLAAAKSAFVRELRAADLRATVVAPSGYFSDIADFMKMAKTGRVWLFGNGEYRMNPIHGTDLATAIFDAAARGDEWADIGGPETFTQNELAQLCFACLGQPARISHLPDFVRQALLWLLPRLAPGWIAGPAQFFLTASAMDMTAPPTGHRRLAAHLCPGADGGNAEPELLRGARP